jgi:PKD repeat protein
MRRLTKLLVWTVCTACGSPPPPPTADPGPDRTAQIGVPVQFDGSGSTGEITSYTWNFGDGSAEATGVQVTHTYQMNGEFSASLTVRGPGGDSTNSALVDVGGACQAQASINVVTASPQPNQPVQFDGSASTGCDASAITDYSWDFGDNVKTDSGMTATVSHTYAVKGTYNVKLVVTDAKGTQGTGERTLDVGISSTGKPMAICPSAVSTVTGQATQFVGNGSVPGGGSITTYTWTFSDDGSMATGQTVTHTFASAGNFTVSLVVGASCGQTSDPCTTPVTVTAPVNYSGAWILNPASSNLMGCSQFGQSFPAACLAITQCGTSMTATPSGNGWPGGVTLAGAECAPGTFSLAGTITTPTTMGGCSTAMPTEAVNLTFTSPTTATGTWRVLYQFSCVTAESCSLQCNCDNEQTFTAAPTTSCP